MKQLRLEITTKSPVIITSEDSAQVLTGTKTYFTGSMIRGMLAELFIKQQQLGKVAHENATFRKLFLGKLVFTNAYPKVEEERAYPLPKSLQRAKTSQEIIDLVYQPGEAGYKGFSGMGIVKQNELYMTSVRSSVHFHMSRQEDHERFEGKSRDGGIYNYESIDAGQTFITYIYGEEAYLQELMHGLPWKQDRLRIRCGRSRRTGYGHCDIRMSPIENVVCDTKAVAQSIQTTKSFCLRLDSTLLGREQLGITLHGINGVAQTVLEELQEAFPTKTFSVEGLDVTGFAAMEKVQSFVGIWGVYRPEAMGLSAGSILFIRTEDDWTEPEVESLHTLFCKGIGERCEEGFGQLRFWIHDQALTMHEATNDTARKVEGPKTLTASTKELLQAILENQIIESIRKQAYQDVQNNIKQLRKADRHTYAQLESYIGSLCESVGKGLDPKVKEGIERIIETNWGYYGFFLGTEQESRSESILTLLLDHGKEPYWVQTSDADMNALIQAYDLPAIPVQNVRKEYWTWFFRYARKVV